MVSLLLVVLASFQPVKTQGTEYCVVKCHIASKHKKVVKPVVKPVVKTEIVREVIIHDPVLVKEQCCKTPVNVVVNVQQSQEQKQVQTQALVEGPVFSLGLRGAVGTWTCGNHLFGLVGLRGHHYPSHLGAEVNTQFYWGHAAQLMVYPVQTGVFNWHLNGGALWFWHQPFAVQDVTRRWDLTAGTGVEVALAKHLALTGDLRVAVPNPGVLDSTPDATGRYMNVGNIVGNSFMRTQFMLGLMFE